MTLITAIGRATALSLALGLSLAAASQQVMAQEARTAATQPPTAAVNPARRAQHLTAEQMMQRVETHLATLRSQLGITPAQEPQWHEFAQVTRDNATAMRQRFSQRAAQLAQMSAADNMMSFARIAEQNAQERVRLATAFRSLYDAMSPEQKQRADLLFRNEHQGQRRGAPRPG